MRRMFETIGFVIDHGHLQASSIDTPAQSQPATLFAMMLFWTGDPVHVFDRPGLYGGG